MRKYWQVLLAASLVFTASFTIAAETKSPKASTTAAESQKTYPGTGRVNSIDSKTGKINITHEAIESLGWGPMTMDFKVQDKEGLAKVKPGDQVDFKLAVPSRGQYVITEIKPKG